MQIIDAGFTNKKKYVEGDVIVIEKTYNGFNHGLNYPILKEFDFVPTLLYNDEHIIKTKFIKGKTLNNPLDQDLILLAQEVRKVHLSSIELPKNNLKKRVNYYLQLMHKKGINVQIIENNYRSMIRLIGRMQKINPVHNDLWSQNIIKDNNNKIWIIDWEYATMGDKHFDLAYYIESQDFSDHQIKVFLDAYDGVNGKKSYNDDLLPIYRKFVLWLTICWGYAQDVLPFPLEPYIQKLKDIS